MSQINPVHAFPVLAKAPFNIFSKHQLSIVSPPKSCMHFFCLPFIWHALPIKSSLTWVPKAWQGVQIVRLLIINFSPPSSYFCPLSCKNLHWQQIFSYTAMFFPACVCETKFLSHAYMCMCTQREVYCKIVGLYSDLFLFVYQTGTQKIQLNCARNSLHLICS